MKKQPVAAADSLPFLDAVPAADPENVPAVASVAVSFPAEDEETAPAVANVPAVNITAKPVPFAALLLFIICVFAYFA